MDPIHLNVEIDPIPDRALTTAQAVTAVMNALCDALLPAEGEDRVADLAVTAEPSAGPGVRWRVGTKLGRTLYQHYGPDDADGELVGLMDTPELAAKVAAAVNAQAGHAPVADVAPTDGWVPLHDHPAVRPLSIWLAQLADDGLEEVEAALRGWLADRHACGTDPTPTGAPSDAAPHAQTAAQPAESHTDGAAAGYGRTASPNSESGTQRPPTLARHTRLAPCMDCGTHILIDRDEAIYDWRCGKCANNATAVADGTTHSET